MQLLSCFTRIIDDNISIYAVQRINEIKLALFIQFSVFRHSFPRDRACEKWKKDLPTSFPFLHQSPRKLARHFLAEADGSAPWKKVAVWILLRIKSYGHVSSSNKPLAEH